MEKRSQRRKAPHPLQLVAWTATAVKAVVVICVVLSQPGCFH